METPYTGSAKLEETYDGIDIIIPSKKNWFAIVFLMLWLGGWCMGETFAVTGLLGLGLFGKAAAGGVNLFLIFWLTGWTIGGFFAFRTLIWNLSGKEVINIRQGEIKLSKKGALFTKPKVYSLNEAKNFRLFENTDSDIPFLGTGRTRNSLSIDIGGTIGFDYGMKTIKFAGGIDDAEANHILQKIRNSKLIN